MVLSRLWSQGLFAAELLVYKPTRGTGREVSQWYVRQLWVKRERLGTYTAGKPEGRIPRPECLLPGQKLKKCGRINAHHAVLLTNNSYLASEMSKTLWIQKISAGNGISAKFKISNCEWQLLADVRFLFICLFSGMFIGFVLIFFFVCQSFRFSDVRCREFVYQLFKIVTLRHLSEIVYDKGNSVYVYCCCRSCLFTEWNIIKQLRWQAE